MLSYRNFVIVGALVASGEMCPLAPEVVIVHDASNTLKETIQKIGEELADQYKEWAESFPGKVKLGLTTFTDKPIPFRGIGGRNALNGEDLDWCYQRLAPLSTDVTPVSDAIKNMNFGHGGDLAESQMDAMLITLTDSEGLGFSSPDVKTDEDGNKVVRVMVMVTDAASHMKGDAQQGIDAFNGKRTYDSLSGYGAFGSSAISSMVNGVPLQDDMAWLSDNYTLQYYAQLSQLYKKQDEGYAMSIEDLNNLEMLKDRFGPDHWSPEQLPYLPLDRPVLGTDCKNYEYADIWDVMTVAAEKNIIPVVMVTVSSVKSLSDTARSVCNDILGMNVDETSNKERAQCVVAWYKYEFEQAGFPDIIVNVFANPKAVMDTLDKTVLAAAEWSCNNDIPVPPEHSTTTTTTVSTTTTTIPTTEPAAPADKTTAQDDDVIADDVTEEGKSSKVGAIAGAAGGAAAAVAAGALLYKKFGASLFGKKPLPDLDAAQQVETPENTVEREGMEEVTMDMFQ